MLGKIAMGVLMTLALLTAYTLREGFLVVRVDETSPEVHHVHLWLPATLASAGLALTPRANLRDAAAKAGLWLPVARQACHELDRSPDFTLVEVEDTGQHVTIQKRGRDLEISVDSAAEKVFVSVPLVSIEDVTRQLQSQQQPI